MAALAIGLALASGGVRSQSLQQLYEQAHASDATYLAARALADSAVYRAEQSHALRRLGPEDVLKADRLLAK